MNRQCEICGAYREDVSLGGSVMRNWTLCNAIRKWVPAENTFSSQQFITDRCWHPKGTIPVIDEKEFEHPLMQYVEWLEREDSGAHTTLIWNAYCENCGREYPDEEVSRRTPNLVFPKCSECGRNNLSWNAKVHPDGTIAIADERPV